MTDSPIVPFEVFQKVPKTYDNPYGIKTVPTYNIDILNSKNPAIFVFTGNGTVDQRGVNGYLSFLNRSLSSAYVSTKETKDGVKNIYQHFSSDKKPDIYGIRYAHYQDKYDGFLTGSDISQMRFDIFDLLCFEKNGTTPLPLETIRKNLRKVVFVSHCAGQTYVNTLLNQIGGKLYDAGMEWEDVEYAMKSVLHISYTPYLEKSTYFGTNVLFMSLSDKIVSDKVFEKFKFDKQHPPYLGVAKIFDVENGFAVVSNSFGNVFHSDYFDDHQISTFFLNGNGVSELHKNSSRAITLANAFANLLAFGVSQKDLSEDDYKLIVQTEIDKEQKTYFEKMQEKEFFIRDKGGYPLLEYMQKNGIDIQDVLNGKIRLKDVVKPIAKTPWGSNIYPKVNFESAGIKESYKFPINKTEESKQIVGYRIEKEDFFNVKHDVTNIVFKDGKERACSGATTADDVYMQAKIEGNKLEDCVRVDVHFNSVETPEKNKLDVCLGKKFVNRKYVDFFDLKQSEIDSGEKGTELSEEQTRVVLNLSRRFWVPIRQIELKDGLKFNKKVLEKEIDLDEQEIVTPISNHTNEKTQNGEKVA